MSSESSDGLVHLRGPYTVSETIARSEGIVSSKGLTVLARIDHSGDVARVGLEMNPTELLIFGSSKAGTPLMVASPTAAIDLALKALAWSDADGNVWLSYNSPEYLAERHSIPSHLLRNIEGISAVCEEAVLLETDDKPTNFRKEL
jgi:uncharacterized protein (DUF302 family)